MTTDIRKTQTRYYTNERTEDFSGIVRTPIRIDGSYRYLRKNPIWKLAEFLVYRVIMTPVAFLWCRIKYHARIIGREKLKACGKFGYFLYGNHTLMDGDAFLPSLCAFPKKTKVVVNADNLSVPITKAWIELSGAVPVPNELSGTRPFLNALEKHTLLGQRVRRCAPCSARSRGDNLPGGASLALLFLHPRLSRRRLPLSRPVRNAVLFHDGGSSQAGESEAEAPRHHGLH